MPQILSLQHYLLYHMQPLSLSRNNSAQPFKEKEKRKNGRVVSAAAHKTQVLVVVDPLVSRVRHFAVFSSE